MMPLQDMINSVLREAEETVKTASAEPTSQCSVCGIAVESGNLCASHAEATKTAGDDAIDLDYAEKLAGAVEYIADYLGKTAAPMQCTLPTNKQTSGKQSLRFGGKPVIPKKPPMEKGTKLKDNKSTMLPAYPKDGVIKTSEERDALKKAILTKLGSGVDNAPSISGSATKGPEGVFAAEQGPSPSGPGGFQLARSIQSAMSYTKGQAKKNVKADLAKVLKAPALSSAADPVLQENLQNTSKAGVKIAGVREELAKIAASGCTCGGAHTCVSCLVRAFAGEFGEEEKLAARFTAKSTRHERRERLGQRRAEGRTTGAARKPSGSTWADATNKEQAQKLRALRKSRAGGMKGGRRSAEKSLRGAVETAQQRSAPFEGRRKGKGTSFDKMRSPKPTLPKVPASGRAAMPDFSSLRRYEAAADKATGKAAKKGLLSRLGRKGKWGLAAGLGAAGAGGLYAALRD